VSTDSEQRERSIVRLVGVSKRFDGQEVLRNVDLGFAEGKTTVVMGPSGCGKTVMLKHVIGLLKPDRGEIWYENTRIDTMHERSLGRVRQQFGFLFQMGALFDSMSVRDNVAFPLVEHTKMTARQRERRVREVLKLVDMTGSISKMPAELSGGQKKRVALARAVVLEPKVLLYDEPTTGLDPIRADVINELIVKLQQELRITSIVVTHDLRSAFSIADVMVMFFEGAVVLEGSPQEFRHSDDPIVQRFIDGTLAADLGKENR
jgi:phospholipid/cholesterol/gamma-HCH transport system ATP-binding protein